MNPSETYPNPDSGVAPPPGDATCADSRTSGGTPLGIPGLGRVLGCFRMVWNWLWGATLTGSLPTGFWVLGWSQLLVRRRVRYHWWRRSPSRVGDFTFPNYLSLEPLGPNWCLGSGNDRSDRSGRWNRLTGGIRQCLRTGLQSAFNAWVLTAPGGLLWATGWYAGWQNSFNKGYEHAWFGPTAFVLGMVWFSLAMIHLPLGLARQASTGDWRRFYDFRLVWMLLNRRWWSGLGLTISWVAASCLAVAAKSAPQFLAGYLPDWTELSATDAVYRAGWSYWALSLVLFPVFVGIRLYAARVYAIALLEAYQTGAVGEDALAETEWHALRHLGLLSPQRPTSPRRRWARAADWLAARTVRGLMASVSLALWLGFGGINLLGEFAAKTEFGRGWWNQPMIQVPWFNYTPRWLRLAAHKERQLGHRSGPVDPLP